MTTVEQFGESQAHESDMIRACSHPDINARIDREMEDRVRQFAGQPHDSITHRIEELDREWDVERWLYAGMGGMSLLLGLYGMAGRRICMLLGLTTQAFLLSHSARGWSPPASALRRLGIRTKHEIETERYALKALRGDFDDVSSASVPVASEESDKLIRHLRM